MNYIFKSVTYKLILLDMNKNIHYCFLVLTLLICGCVGSKKDAEVDIDFTYTISTNDTIVDKFNYDELIDSIFIVRLETSESCLIDEVDKVIFFDSTCFVLDRKMGVFAFSMNGDFIQKVGGIGRAPGEYLSCYDISISDSLLYVYDNGGWKMHYYNASNYNYIDSYIQKNSVIESIVKGDYVFEKGGVGEKTNLKSKLLMHGGEDEITLFSIEPDEFDIRMHNQILTSNSKDFWIDPLRCEVYELNLDGGVTPYFKLNEPEFILAKNELKDVTSNGEIEKRGKITYFSDYYETSNHQIVKYLKDNEFWTLYHDKKRNKLYHTNMNIPYYIPFKDLDGVYNDFFVKVYSEVSFLVSFYNNEVRRNSAFKGAYSGLNELKDVNEFDNPVLIFARFK